MNTTLGSSFLESTSNRPRERIRFATPQAEKKYKKILRQQQQNAKKSNRPLSLMQIPVSLETSDDDSYSLSSSKKRSFSSENSAEPSRKKSRMVVGKKFEDPFIASLGPIPPANSDIFANMSFVLCYASDSDQCVSRSHDCKENEGGWKDQPFYSEDRLTVQIKAGGGKVYTSLDLVPTEERESTKLVTNAPSLHPERVLCFEVGVPAYSHRWIIRCCQQVI